MSLLPALLTSVVLAGSPAMRYSSSLRAETFLRSENAPTARRAMDALVRLGTPAAVAALAQRLRAVTVLEQRAHLVKALGSTRHPDAVAVPLVAGVHAVAAPVVRCAR